MPIYIGITLVTSFVFAYHLIRAKSLTRFKLRILYIYYHVALLALCVFVTPYLTPFDALWVILAIGMDLLFGRRWIFLTLGIYCVFVLFALYRMGDALTPLIILTSVLRVVGLFCVALLASKFRQISDEERDVIKNSFRDKEIERQRLLLLINNMGEAVAAVDQDGKIMIYNSRFLMLLDTNEKIEQRDIANLLHLKSKEGDEVNFGDMLKDASSEYSTSDYSHQISDQESIHLFISIAPIRLGFRENNTTGWIVILRDITKEKSLEDKKDEFISVVGHELRTPIAIAEGTVGNMLMLAEKENFDNRVKEVLQKTHDQVIQLSGIINNISTLSQAEDESKDAGSPTNIKVDDFIAAIAEMYSGRVKDKGLIFNIEVANNKETPFIFKSYKDQLLTVVGHLLDNAIKYTEQGDITLRFRGSENEVYIDVQDTGPGIRVSDKEHIFDKFFQSEHYETRSVGGNGLGLYISKKIIEELGGRLVVDSAIGRGSTFTIKLPRI